MRRKGTLPRVSIKKVLFDIGGVLTPDPWETLLFHTEHGVIRESGIAVEEATAQIAHVWNTYAVLNQSEEVNFWKAASDALETHIDPAAVGAIRKSVLTPNAEHPSAFETLQQRNIDIGLISNNTAFFYAYQAELLSLHAHVDPTLVYLSHEKGIAKSDGLFELAAAQTSPNEVLVIDDRPGNISRASKCGFHTTHYHLDTGRSLVDIVTDTIERAK